MLCVSHALDSKQIPLPLPLRHDSDRTIDKYPLTLLNGVHEEHSSMINDTFIAVLKNSQLLRYRPKTVFERITMVGLKSSLGCFSQVMQLLNIKAE